jgi:hypothetical protein
MKKSNFACVFMRNISQNDSGERCGPWASCLNLEISFQDVANYQKLNKRGLKLCDPCHENDTQFTLNIMLHGELHCLVTILVSNGVF